MIYGLPIRHVISQTKKLEFCKTVFDIADKKSTDLLDIIQSDFPITETPFRDVAERLEWTEHEVITSLKSLIDSKIIRTFGPVFDPRKLGYTSTLIAAEVSSERVAELAASMLAIQEITHNYLREHELNLWFTITARSEKKVTDICKWAEKFPGVKRTLNLPVITVYKINAVFLVDNNTALHNGTLTDTPRELNESEQNIVMELQRKFPLVERPFQVIADAAGTKESELIEKINRWLTDGTMRRFGARLNHKRAGYIVNILAAWKGEYIDTWGKKFAELDEITHCYRRKTHRYWPYELYTMIHAKTEKEMADLLTNMKAMAPGAVSVLLKTMYELKKTSMKFFLEEGK